MPKNLIIKTSSTKLPNGELKSNLGDLIRATVLLNCIEKDFLWLTDSKSSGLLKWFVDPKKLITYENLNNKLLYDAEKIYNLDNYVFDKDVFDNLKGHWKGYVYKEGNIFPENEAIESITPYTTQKIGKSWQQDLLEGLGFEWQEQDFASPRIKKKEETDVGLNWHVHPEWTSKHWPYEKWEELADILEKNYLVSWQQGLSDSDKYVNWLSSCRLIVTCDTLGLHLASALRKKIVAMVGPTDNKEFHYNRITFVKPPERECMPCNIPECEFENNCLSEIRPIKIKDIVSEILEGWHY